MKLDAGARELRSFLAISVLMLASCLFGSTASAQNATPPPQAYPPQQAYPQGYPPPAAVAPYGQQQQPPPAYAPPGAPAPAAPGMQPQPYMTAPAPGSPYYAPRAAPGSALVAQQPKPRISRGLMIGGIVTLGSTYLIGMLSAAIVIDVDPNNCRQCREVGARLFVPVFGPFLAIEPAEHAQGLLALFGVTQVAGLAMTIGGIVKYRKSKRRAEELGYAQFDLGHGRSLALDVSATPYKLGPRLSLKF